MSEAEAIARTSSPATVGSLTADLQALGVVPGCALMVHSSLSRLGFVAGGAHAVVAALLAAVGPEGTVMMPTHSGHLGNHELWENPPAPTEWWPVLRAETIAYDPLLSPTREMGAIVDCFRHVPGVLRSGHPTVSAAAVGPLATALVGDHPLPHGLGEGSPQARLYDHDGWILLLGVGHANNTSLHLAEHRSAPPDAPVRHSGSPMMVDGRRQWVEYDELVVDTDDFDAAGAAFAATGPQRTGPIGAGVGHLMRAREVVDFATTWFREHRG